MYSQAVLLETPLRPGVLLLPTTVSLVPGGIVSGLILTKTGRYRPLHLAGYALMTLGAGLFTLLDKNASLAVYVIVQIVAGLGSGLALTTLLPATQAALSERDTASSTVTWTFVRRSGTVWGVAVPSAIFNTRASAAAGTAAAGRIEDAAARTMVAYGQAYAHASSELRLALPSRAREQVIGVFTDSLRLVWIVAAVIAGFSFFVVFVEKEIKLRDDLETEFGLKGGEVDGGREEEGGKGSEKGIVG